MHKVLLSHFFSLSLNGRSRSKLVCFEDYMECSDLTKGEAQRYLIDRETNTFVFMLKCIFKIYVFNVHKLIYYKMSVL